MREELGIDDWLELVKEDKNLNGAYISFAQYMYLLEKENQELNQKYLNAVADYEQEKFKAEELKKELEDMTLCRDIASGHRKEVQDRETICLKANQELKKQLEEFKQQKQEWINLLNMFKNQQKAFIDWLEEEISKWHYNYDSYTGEFELEEPSAEELLEDALSKYKEIIGVENEN